MLESAYQAKLIKRLKVRFPGCIILKNDSSYQQGIPDLIMLFEDRWAMLEVKSRLQSREQANQDYFIGLLDEMSFAAFISPEIEEEVLDALQRSFESCRTACLSQR